MTVVQKVLSLCIIVYFDMSNSWGTELIFPTCLMRTFNMRFKSFISAMLTYFFKFSYVIIFLYKKISVILFFIFRDSTYIINFFYLSHIYCFLSSSLRYLQSGMPCTFGHTYFLLEIVIYFSFLKWLSYSLTSFFGLVSSDFTSFSVFLLVFQVFTFWICDVLLCL